MKSTSSEYDIYAVFGNPVAHSLSPLMHQAALDHTGQKAFYVPFCVTALREAVQGIRGLNIRGVSVTLPFKTAVMEFLDEIDQGARRIGAVNTIWNDQGRLKGFNTDWNGFVFALKKHTEIRGKKFVVLGAGGAARGIVYGLIREGGEPILVNRTASKAEALAREFGCAFAEEPGIEMVGADGLINTTPLGMSPRTEDTPWEGDDLHRFKVVMDIIYNPLETRLLKEARSAGCRTVSGLEMFIHQGAEQFKLWTGLEAPVAIMRQVVMDKLDANDPH
ncbi:MAG TPA: shikimate dehydrogenase [Thermodesulfobacteriota bacterium]|nr:shikimate dehydrogenase [Thermodesulfobacteriota bacterium]